MKHAVMAAVFACVFAGPAFAQMVPDGNNGPSGSAPTPRAPTPDIAPPALPGAGEESAPATGPVVQKPVSGDPTTALFAAVNSGDYNAAQDAVGRGADLNAQNALGETPLDLSIALNRNNITFMLLSARNEAGNLDEGDGTGMPPAAATPASTAPVPYRRRHVDQSGVAAPTAGVVPVAPAATPGSNPGTPNAAAGFLGFGTSQ
jgi:hypothetical protein